MSFKVNIIVLDFSLDELIFSFVVLSMKIILFVFFLYSSSTFASNSDLLKEFMNNNFEVLKAKTDISLSAYDTQNVIDKKFWGLGLSSKYSDNTLEEITGTGATKLRTLSNSISLSKDFNWGGHLTFGMADSSFSPNDGNIMVKNDKNMFSQSLRYSQDLGANFFGQIDRNEIAMAKQTEEITKSASSLKTSADLLSFYAIILKASLNRTMVRLAKEAHLRAVSNTKLIQKRVRDGLREKIDLYQAQINEKSLLERMIGAEKALEQSRAEIASKIHRTIEITELDVLNLERPNYLRVPSVKWESYKEKELLLSQLSLGQLAIDQVDHTFLPTIKLAGSYQTNDYDASSSEARSNGAFGADQKEYAASINLMWPIGNEVQKNNMAKQKALLMLKSAEIKKKESSYKDSVRSLYAQLALLEKSLESAKERVELARKILTEFGRLYRQGRAGIDRLLDAESSLIATENSYANYIYARKVLVGNLYFLGSELEKALIMRQ